MTIYNYPAHVEAQCIKDEDTGCWNWTRATHQLGYAFMRHRGTMAAVQRVMAIELELFDNIDFHTRISTSCENRLCCNPEHIIQMNYTEMTNRRYAKHGTGGKMYGKEEEVRDRYNDMKSRNVYRTINKIAEEHDCHPTIVYRAIKTANERDEKK